MNETMSVELAGAEMTNFPSELVVVPVEEPSTRTVAPTIGPSGPETVPVIDLVWARREKIPPPLSRSTKGEFSFS